MTFKEFIDYQIIQSDNISLTVYQILLFVFILVATWLAFKIVQKFINKKFKKVESGGGSRYAVFQILKYFVWVIVIGIALETIGIRFNLLIASSAALLVGLGFGLQQIFNDYISGLLILFEGNLKVQDVVQMEDGTIGRVMEINLRTSKIETRDEYFIIVPNHRLINNNIINWSHMESRTRFQVNVGVAYGSDTSLVEKTLLACANGHPEITTTPNPFVRFVNFGESSLDFQLYFWTEKTFRVENIKSSLRFRIDQEFKKNNIRIPFPQRDVHIIKDGA
ncbi:MAG: mechanosensitive ion channel [Bacteroidales bacterium]|nr:mechanosensitive ion channel [Bacteroidales bacterium]